MANTKDFGTQMSPETQLSYRDSACGKVTLSSCLEGASAFQVYRDAPIRLAFAVPAEEFQGQAIDFLHESGDNC
jgi:hypothetical protein